MHGKNPLFAGKIIHAGGKLFSTSVRAVIIPGGHARLSSPAQLNFCHEFTGASVVIPLEMKVHRAKPSGGVHLGLSVLCFQPHPNGRQAFRQQVQTPGADGGNQLIHHLLLSFGEEFTVRGKQEKRHPVGAAGVVIKPGVDVQGGCIPDGVKQHVFHAPCAETGGKFDLGSLSLEQARGGYTRCLCMSKKEHQ